MHVGLGADVDSVLDVGAGYADVLTLVEGTVWSVDSAEGAAPGAWTAVMGSPYAAGPMYGGREGDG